MRLHVVGLPHTHTTQEFASCAFTQKVVRFCAMMRSRGYHIILYSGEQNSAVCDQHICCIPESDRAVIVGDKHYTEADWNHPYSAMFTLRVAYQMAKRILPGDIICLIGGYTQKPIADAFPQNLSVEFGIGYSGTFAKYRVFESYAWMHMVYGAESGGAEKKDGHWFDAVIPNQVDAGHSLGKGDGGYALYVGRLIDRKGYRIAQEVCDYTKTALVLAGPGVAQGYGEFAGEVDASRRYELMCGAKFLIAPTQYVEPFGTVTIEAMACGTPVICTDWGAFTETVQQGVHGYRCRSFQEFVEAIALVGSLDRSKIREDALARFSMPVVAKQYDEYFKRLETLYDKGWYQGKESTDDDDDVREVATASA